MAVPDYQSLMLPVLRLAATGIRRVPEAAEVIADEFELTPEDRAALLPSGTQKLLPNRVHWARTYLMKAGLLSSPARGQFTITLTGRDLLASSPATITRAMLEQYPSFVSFVGNKPDGTGEHLSRPRNTLRKTGPRQSTKNRKDCQTARQSGWTRAAGGRHARPAHR